MRDQKLLLLYIVTHVFYKTNVELLSLINTKQSYILEYKMQGLLGGVSIAKLCVRICSKESL